MSQSSPDCAIQAIIASKSSRKAKPAYDFALYPVERFLNAHQALSRDRNTLERSRSVNSHREYPHTVKIRITKKGNEKIWPEVLALAGPRPALRKRRRKSS